MQTNRLIKILKNITQNKKKYSIGIYGLTYKSYTNIIKSSQGEDLLKSIIKNKINYRVINIYDKFLDPKDVQNIKKKINFYKKKSSFINKSNVIFLMYKGNDLNLSNFKINKKKYVIDCWRYYKSLPKPYIKIDLGKSSKFN